MARSYSDLAGILLPQSLNIIRSEGQKPYFESVPTVHFSVSHSDELWCCAFCDAPIGLDIQRHVACNMQGIAKRFFHPKEYKHLEANGYAGFFDIWVAKESYVKLTGQGIDDAFSSFCVVDEAGLLDQMDGKWFGRLHVLSGYSLCLCCNQAPKIVIAPKISLD